MTVAACIAGRRIDSENCATIVAVSHLHLVEIVFHEDMVMDALMYIMYYYCIGESMYINAIHSIKVTV